MASADAMIDEPLLLHGVASLDALDMIGPGRAVFAGVQVRAIKEGSVAALVSMAPRIASPPPWLSWLPTGAGPNLTPVLSALSSLMPVLPVAPGTVFEGEVPLRRMLSAREIEIRALINDHSSLLECEVIAGFDAEHEPTEIAALGRFAFLAGENAAERLSMAQAEAQSRAGQRAAYFARLKRLLGGAIDSLHIDGKAKRDMTRRRVLIARHARLEFKSTLRSLVVESGAGAWLRLGPFLPAISFRRLEIASADVVKVGEARTALGVEESVDRNTIRTAYQRTLERFYPRATAAERVHGLNHLQSLFGLLELVADGQIKAARGEKTLIRFDAETLKDTWLLRFHQHDLADKAA